MISAPLIFPRAAGSFAVALPAAPDATALRLPRFAAAASIVVPVTVVPETPRGFTNRFNDRFRKRTP